MLDEVAHLKKKKQNVKSGKSFNGRNRDTEPPEEARRHMRAHLEKMEEDRARHHRATGRKVPGPNPAWLDPTKIFSGIFRQLWRVILRINLMAYWWVNKMKLLMYDFVLISLSDCLKYLCMSVTIEFASVFRHVSPNFVRACSV